MSGKRVKFSITVLYSSLLMILVLVAICGSRAVSVICENTIPDPKVIIVLDAGHGGPDGGATSCTGATESALNLEIVLRLSDLMHLLGMNTKEIRRTDISVYTEGETIAAKKVSDLRNRVSIINNTENAILLSIHQNYYTDQRYSGPQVFYAPTTESKQFARNMQTTLVLNLDEGSRRQSKPADGVFLMRHIQCPGILIECGFLSNPEEEAKIRSELYQKKLCCVIAAETLSYIDSNYKT